METYLFPLREFKTAMIQSSQTLLALWNNCENAGPSDPSWDLLFEEILPMFSKIARRACFLWGVTSAAEQEDLVQELNVKLAQSYGEIRTMSNVPSEASAFEAYMRAFGANAARDCLKKRFAQKRSPKLSTPIDDHLSRLSAPETWRGVDKDILLAQVTQRLNLTAMELTVFHLYFTQGFSAREIASLRTVGLTVKGVESLIHRVTSQMRHELSAKTQSGLKQVGSAR